MLSSGLSNFAAMNAECEAEGQRSTRSLSVHRSSVWRQGKAATWMCDPAGSSKEEPSIGLVGRIIFVGRAAQVNPLNSFRESLDCCYWNETKLGISHWFLLLFLQHVVPKLFFFWQDSAETLNIYYHAKRTCGLVVQLCHDMSTENQKSPASI
jgi:hypothetical protein